MKINRRFKNKNSRAGATAVEFALTLPILLLFLFGTFELSRGNMMINTTEGAAYEAARVAIIPGSSAEEVELAARQTLVTAGIKNFDFQMTPENLNTDSETVSVQLSVSFADNSLLVPAFLKNTTFVRTCVLNRETTD